MFYLEIQNLDNFSKHLHSNGVREAFVFIKPLKDLPQDTKFRVAVFTARLNDYIALCARKFRDDPEAEPEKDDLVRIEEKYFKLLGIEVKFGCWTGEPPPNLSGQRML